MKKLQLLASLLLLLCSVPAFGAIAKVQSTSAVNGSNYSSVALAFTSNLTTGNYAVLSIQWTGNVTATANPPSQTITSVVATNSRVTMTLSKCNTTNAIFAVCIYSGQIISSGAETLTVNFSAGGAYYGATQISEWSGVATSSALDQVGQAAGTSATSACTTAGATAVTGELIYGATAVEAGTPSPSGYTTVQINGGNTSAFKLGSAAQSETVTWTGFTSSNWVCVIATYKPPSTATRRRVTSF